jgi:hypothetical protein
VANGNTTPSRLGDINAGGGDQLELFLKVFAGEVLASYNDRTVMMDRHRVKSISSGRSAQFPAIGRATAGYHVVGEDLLDGANSYVQAINHSERIIHIDEVLTSVVFTAEIDEWMNHYETRSEYAKQLGRALAERGDKQIMQVLGLAAAAAATVTGGDGGSTINGGATVHTDMDLFADAVYEAAKILDTKNVPSEDRYVLCTPEVYWRLVRMGGTWGGGATGAPVELLDADFSSDNGDVAGGRIARIAGMQIVPSNIWDLIDGQNVTGVTGERGVGTAGSATGTNYAVNLTNVQMICFQKEAVGTVKMRDMVVQSEYQLTHGGTLMVAKYAMGHGILRPECAVAIKNLV